MTRPVLFPPLKIVTRAECFRLDDRRREGIAFIYFSDRPDHARAAGRLSRDEARMLATRIARLLTDDAGGRD